MSADHDSPEQAVRGLRPPAHPSASDESDEDPAERKRTSPFPYAESFDEWVADETADPDGRRHDSAAGDADA